MTINKLKKPASQGQIYSMIICFLFIHFFLLSCSDKKENSSAKIEIDNPMEKKASSEPEADYRLNPTEETASLYQWYCAQCHGVTGEGNGINSAEMPSRPINHKDPALMSMKSDRDLFKAISKGGPAISRAPCMPPWGQTLDKITIASLVGYLRKLCECEFSGYPRQTLPY